jgi:hypothetical protein
MKRSAAALALLAAAGGCGDGKQRMKLYPVEGKVLVDGQPPSNAVVVFFPDSPWADVNADYPRAGVKEDGSFKVTTYRSGDGAPPGSYRVTVDTSSRAEGLEKREDPLKGRYRDPDKSGLRADVAEGDNSLPVFDLKSP